jgi:hypothetical protein
LGIRLQRGAVWTFRQVTVVLGVDAWPSVTDGAPIKVWRFSMAYVSDLEDGVPYKQIILDNPLEAILRVAVGRDDAAQTQYSAQVSLITLEPFYGDMLNMELQFDIVASHPGGTMYIGDGSVTKAFLVGKDRSDALEVICSSAHFLLQHRNPDAVSFSTLQPNLPKKALRKYEAVSRAVRAAGYVGGHADGFEGHTIWMFTRRPDVA